MVQYELKVTLNDRTTIEVTSTSMEDIQKINKAIIEVTTTTVEYECLLAYKKDNGYGSTCNKIGAIKKYRELTGAGLKDSKEMIEHYIDTRW